MDYLFDADAYTCIRALGYCDTRDWLTIEQLLALLEDDRG